jgi:hypothetical protein
MAYTGDGMKTIIPDTPKAASSLGSVGSGPALTTAPACAVLPYHNGLAGQDREGTLTARSGRLLDQAMQ